MKKLIVYQPLGRYTPKENPIKKTIKYLIFIIGSLIFEVLCILSRKKIKKKIYNLSIAAIFKNEAEFLREWITYHQLIGVDHIYLYNNFSDDNYSNILEKFIEEKYITLIDWPVDHGQLAAYNHCLNNFSVESNWIAFIDIDEFICLKEHLSIKDFLLKYKNYPSLLLNWKMFGTSGIIDRDKDKLIIEQFTSSWSRMTNIGKSIVNTAYSFSTVNHCHIFNAKIWGLKIPPVDEFRNFIVYWHYFPNLLRRDSTAQINHYWSKSYSDFIYKDTVRGSAMSSNASNLRKSNLIERFNYHENMNTEKDYTIQKHLVFLKDRYNH